MVLVSVRRVSLEGHADKGQAAQSWGSTRQQQRKGTLGCSLTYPLACPSGCAAMPQGPRPALYGPWRCPSGRTCQPAERACVRSVLAPRGALVHFSVSVPFAHAHSPCPVPPLGSPVGPLTTLSCAVQQSAVLPVNAVCVCRSYTIGNGRSWEFCCAM